MTIEVEVTWRPRTRAKYSDEYKREAVKEPLFGGKTLKETAERYGVTRGVLRSWYNRYADDLQANEKPGVPRLSSIEDLETKVRALEIALLGEVLEKYAEKDAMRQYRTRIAKARELLETA